MPVPPKFELSPGDFRWGQWVTDSIEEFSRGRDRAALDSTATDKGLAASVAGLERTLAEILETQASLAATQVTLADQIAFLQTQVSYDTKSTQDTFSGANTGTTWESFNSTYDCAITLVSPASGLLAITGGGFLLGSTLTAALGIEIPGELSLSFPGPTTAAALNAAATASRTTIVGVTPNTSMTVRLRRGRIGTASGATTWAYQTLAVTKLA